MVSKKLLVVLLILGILMFTFSIAIAISDFNKKDISISGENIAPDSKEGQISIIINKPIHAPN